MAPTTTSTYSSMRGGQTTSNNNGQKSAQKYLTNCKSLYSCIHCRTHLANHDELVSRSFQGNRGRAYLFNSVINIFCGPSEQRELNTGSHSVADIFCSNCDKNLGWKYEKAFVEAQKYKEGKYLIELEHVVRENRHLELDKGEIFFNRNKRNRCSSSSLLFNNRKQQGSLTPPPSSSSNRWSSSAAATPPTTNSSFSYEEVDEDDEELMFPFYDDLCDGRSSYPSNLSSSHHNRMRRSLYLDSTPYDWKYSATSSLAKSPLCSEDQSNSVLSSKNLASSLDSAYSSTSPSTSSSSSSSPQSPSSSTSSSAQSSGSLEQKSSNHIKCNFNNNKKISSGDGNKSYQTLKIKTCDDNQEETQFKFEVDRPEPPGVGISAFSKPLIDATKQSSNLSNSGTSDNAHNSLHSNSIDIDFDQPTSSYFSNETKLLDVVNSDNYGCEEKSCMVNNSRMSSSSSSSISLDDEKFYDCLTDHDIARLMVSSD